jgi:hypothetical protein
MNKQTDHLRPYALRLAIFSLLVALIFFTGSAFAPDRYVSSAWPFLALFFPVLTFLMHYLLTATGMTMNRFVNTYMMLTVVKLLLFLSILLVYVLLRKADALAFSIAFFVFYGFFTVFEIIFLLKHHRRADNKA